MATVLNGEKRQAGRGSEADIGGGGELAWGGGDGKATGEGLMRLGQISVGELVWGRVEEGRRRGRVGCGWGRHRRGSWCGGGLRQAGGEGLMRLR